MRKAEKERRNFSASAREMRSKRLWRSFFSYESLVGKPSARRRGGNVSKSRRKRSERRTVLLDGDSQTLVVVGDVDESLASEREQALHPLRDLHRLVVLSEFYEPFLGQASNPLLELLALAVREGGELVGEVEGVDEGGGDGRGGEGARCGRGEGEGELGRVRSGVADGEGGGEGSDGGYGEGREGEADHPACLLEGRGGRGGSRGRWGREKSDERLGQVGS